MINDVLLEFAQWLGAKSWSTGLHESFYMYNWIETSHVLTLMLCLGMLGVIDLRMLGWILKDIPASKIAARLHKPMIAGFTYMFISGILLYSAIPIRTTQSLWFRIKMILLVAAGINAWLFNRHLARSHASWDLVMPPPKRTRVAAGLSLVLWAGIVVCGRFIAYDWFDCGGEPNPPFIDWAAGCTAG